MANYFGGGNGGRSNERPGQTPTAPTAPGAGGMPGGAASTDPSASAGGAAPSGGSAAGGEGQGGAPGGASSLLPAVSLPKGGGAIRGIGEKFSVNAATGTASLSVPIAASPGRNGFGPQVALSYDSGNGNSPFGLGFQLSIPMVSRKTDKGLPRYIDDAESDEYIVSGAEDLVPTLEPSGEFVELPRTIGTVNYRVRRYRPRVEGSFARIERWIKVLPGDPTDGDVHWRVTSRDNVTNLYGLTPAARIADPDAPAEGRNARVFSWLLEETHDDKGNIVKYVYKAEDGAGVDPTRLSEKSRFEGSAFVATAQRYLKRVLYCNATPFDSTDFLMELVFDYGEHLPTETTPSAVPSPAENAPWPVRQDPFSSYRSTFEVRTYRLCRRVLMFHRFAPNIGGVRAPLLVKSTDFIHEESASFTYLVGVTQAGYLNDASTDNVWQRQTLPTLRLDYTRPVVNDELRAVPPESLHGLEGGVEGGRKQWVDLDGEGIPGVLIDADSAWFYKANRGNGELDAPRVLRTMPSPASLTGGLQRLEDLGGDGQLDLAAFGEPLQGYFSRTPDGDFEPLRPFGAVPNIDFSDPNLRSIDLDGDGLPDLLITEDQAFVWYRSRGKEGFDPVRRLVVPSDDEHGPAVVFADAEQSIQLADMSGDGLTDIVRIRNGELSYWPNLGYGRFGKKVTLENCPAFAAIDEFDARRIRFGDIDGTGTSDLFYLGPRETRLYFNHAGNGFSPATTIHSLPPTDNLTSLGIVDLLGQGTACLVWSSPLQTPRPLFFVDLMDGVKPHLLRNIKNNLGAETTFTFATSTKFYLEDKAAGIPWLTRLSFPVHVVERIERVDSISNSRLVTSYRYRHGYFDGEEREFRGFARVEQLDAEEFTVGTDTELYQAPVRTVTWFHTGAWLERERFEAALQEEYFPVGPKTLADLALLLPDTVLPEGLSLKDQREAARALRGSMLRQEIYAEDGTDKADKPYLTTEQNFGIRSLQSSTPSALPTNSPDCIKHGVFFVHGRESVAIHSERNPADPRVTHDLVLEVDDFGNVLESASLAYPRLLTDEPEQGRLLGTYSVTWVKNQTTSDASYRLGVPIEGHVFELSGLATLEPGQLLALSDVRNAFENATEIPFEDEPSFTSLERRSISRERRLYYSDDLTTALPLGDIGIRAIEHQTQSLAFTQGLLDSVLGVRVSAAMLTGEGRYLLQEEAWWSVSGRVVYSAPDFYSAIEAFDPFGGHSQLDLDAYSMLTESTTDPAGNIISATNDYRVLSPFLVTDPNGNRTEVLFDALGRVVRTAVMGKVGESLGDTIAEPTQRFQYALDEFVDGRGPTFVRTTAREQHGPSNPRFQDVYLYSDGFGREVMRKIQAEPGLAPLRDPGDILLKNPDGSLVLGEVAARWVGTGRTVFNNKGNPVKQYEPYFSSTSKFETESDVAESGVTAILRYDSLDRVVRTDFPDGSVSRTEFDAWHKRTYDPNDAVQGSAWLSARQAPGASPEDQRAAALTLAHADTPTETHFDSLGRAFLVIAHHRSAGVDAFLPTRNRLDIAGNVRSMTDARGNVTVEQRFDLLSRQLSTKTPDAGERLMLPDVAGKPIRSWDSRNQTFRRNYDALQRPTHVFVAQGSAAEALVERTVYGEGHPQASAKNLRGKVYQTYDGAGANTNEQLDFKGNLVDTRRRLATEYHETPNWALIAAVTDVLAVEATADANSLLEAENFTLHTDFDALNRSTLQRTHDGSVFRPSFNEANLLETLHLSVRNGPEQLVVSNIDYNARGQRISCEHANPTTNAPSTRIEYTYDPLTFRLSRLVTQRTSDSLTLQDLRYTYDAIGNIVAIQDRADTSPLFTVVPVSGDGLYEYDSLYRLTRAEGREHPGQQPTPQDPARGGVPHPNDLQALRRYDEEYEYDAAGNIGRVVHHVGAAGWTRRYEYASSSNRLLRTSAPGDADGTFSDVYSYNAHGAMASTAHLFQIDWDFADRMRHANLGGGGDVYFSYSSGGKRVRKVYEHSGLLEERIYLGNFELYRRRGIGSTIIDLERETLHVFDDKRRVALVETKTIDTADGPSGSRYRFQLDNSLGSALLELDESASVISYEEFHPYGSTAFHTARGGAEVSAKRYRYTGKERDEETGLYYHGARYYAAWLGRWTSADTLALMHPGTADANLYAYVRCNPINHNDPTGLQEASLTARPIRPGSKPADPEPVLVDVLDPDFDGVIHSDPNAIEKLARQTEPIPEAIPLKIVASDPSAKAPKEPTIAELEALGQKAIADIQALPKTDLGVSPGGSTGMGGGGLSPGEEVLSLLGSVAVGAGSGYLIGAAIGAAGPAVALGAGILGAAYVIWNFNELKDRFLSDPYFAANIIGGGASGFFTKGLSTGLAAREAVPEDALLAALGPGARRGALDTSRAELLGTLAARARQLAGFAEEGAPIILDENIAGRGVAEALRARGFNVRDVYEIYGRGGVSDPEITQLAELIGARVLTQNVRDFPAAVRIGVDARIGVHVDSLARVLSNALR